ncbi:MULTISPECIES: phage protein [unclassified Salinivibrio]|uniref:Putative tail tube protein n=1 Tax=Salinivibrio phage SMHB1 TaxID=1897436 RepID=A0A1D9C9S0_9CAUD|nr:MULTISPECIES: phage protein [unclassified Salinivibrio]YP_009786977.1 tail protein [Salinivibrio phage SMHB1]AOY11840.1 putative tail tube protein [Salinivibrio phage SMHB1]KKA45148.1 tail protein [Salinivibrio sp. KP-1]ODP98277.1 phage tail protein [Salinivibrio sp. BNH]
MSTVISGKNLRFNIGDLKIVASKWTCSITDNSATNKSNGVPDGWVEGDVEASGEIELTTTNFNLLMKAAENAGAFRALPEFDAMGYGKTNKDELKVEMFGIRLKISDLLDVDANGGSALMHKIPYEVTSPDFVHINGVPYLREDEIEDLVN